MSTLERIAAEAMNLPAADRWRLVERLMSSLESDDEIARAWAEEVERRIDAFERGDTSATPVDDVIAAGRARIGGGTA
ncbi:addiction module protein [Thauera sp. 2A1]|uniref:addiction module protein n=1 Tax=Thauera sp. 2A1 TaxID=2570191 RepID=UPI0012916101|nr:addiction module protein [Thauera sp. 2A1]KAI5915422.1 addiction module protein [Thauera sp. 2A1]